MAHLSPEDLSGYSLQALDAEEARAVEEHLSTCLECREALDSYNQIANGLLLAVPPKAPPAQLRSRLAQSIVTGRPVRETPKRGFRFPLFQAALGLAVIVLLVVSVALAVQVHRLQQEQAALLKMLQGYQSELALVSQPGVTLLPAQTNQITGNMAISPDGKSAALFLRGLSPLDGDHAYQVWLIPASGAPESAGLFQVTEGQQIVSFLVTTPGSIKEFANIGITVEPRKGSPAPTTKPIFLGNL